MPPPPPPFLFEPRIHVARSAGRLNHLVVTGHEGLDQRVDGAWVLDCPRATPARLMSALVACLLHSPHEVGRDPVVLLLLQLIQAAKADLFLGIVHRTLRQRAAGLVRVDAGQGLDIDQPRVGAGDPSSLSAARSGRRWPWGRRSRGDSSCLVRADCRRASPAALDLLSPLGFGFDLLLATVEELRFCWVIHTE